MGVVFDLYMFVQRLYRAAAGSRDEVLRLQRAGAGRGWNMLAQALKTETLPLIKCMMSTDFTVLGWLKAIILS